MKGSPPGSRRERTTTERVCDPETDLHGIPCTVEKNATAWAIASSLRNCRLSRVFPGPGTNASPCGWRHSPYPRPPGLRLEPADRIRLSSRTGSPRRTNRSATDALAGVPALPVDCRRPCAPPSPCSTSSRRPSTAGRSCSNSSRHWNPTGRSVPSWTMPRARKSVRTATSPDM